MSRATSSGRPIPVMGVQTAGSAAAAILRDGKPLAAAAVFERSFYCRDGRDRWLCFLRADLEPGPLHALSSNWPARLREHVSEGQEFVFRKGGVLAASTLLVEFGAFQEWRPPAFPPPNPSALRRALPRLREAMRMSAPPDTLAALAAGCLQPGDGWRKNVLTEASRALAALTRWLASPRGHPPRDAIRALVGLGPGLTPTGDDVISGVLLALHALGMRKEAREIAAGVETYGPEGTNRISLAHLRAAVTGEGAAPFHDILCEAMRGRETFDGCLRRIDAIGHSSGWDVLAGMAAAIEWYVAHGPPAS